MAKKKIVRFWTAFFILAAVIILIVSGVSRMLGINEKQTDSNDTCSASEYTVNMDNVNADAYN